MKHLLLLISVFFLGVTQLNASLADPTPLKHTQPDGSVLTIRQIGDEFMHYTLGSDGYIIAMKADGFYYYVDYSSGARVVTSARADKGVPSGVTRYKEPPMSVIDRSLNLRRQRSYSSVLSRSATTPIKPTKVLILLVEFSNLSFSTPADRLIRQFTQRGYSDAGATGSVLDYFADNSGETYLPQFDVSAQVIRMPQKVDYYGENDAYGNDMHPEIMVRDACLGIDKLGVDFSQYDSDNDGVVDVVYVIYAGYNEADNGGEETIWPHAYDISDLNITIDGKRLGQYACSSELKSNGGIEGIGTFCHEFSHILGVPDMYDTDYFKNGQSEGLGSLSVMHSGDRLNNSLTPCYYNAIEREILGWSTPEIITKANNYTLTSVATGKSYRVDTPNPGEYFVFECRHNTEKWDQYISASGLLVYHVDKSNNIVSGARAVDLWSLFTGTYANMLNAFSSHPCVRVLKSSGGSLLKGLSEVFYPGSDNKRAIQSLYAWSGTPINNRIDNITYANGIASFDLINEAGENANKPASFSRFVIGETELFFEVKPTEANKNKSFTFKIIDANNVEVISSSLPDSQALISGFNAGRQYRVEVWSEDGISYISKTFTTKSPTLPFPVISGFDREIKAGEVIPLMLLNLQSTTKSIKWSVGSQVIPSKAVYFEPGRYKISCEITYSDNDIEIITTIVNVK